MTETKSLDTLVDDIYGLFGKDTLPLDEDFVARFREDLTALVVERLGEERVRDKTLRMSTLGKPDRQLWYDMHWEGETEPLQPQAYIKFMYGDVLEHLALLFARQTGHSVTFEQTEVEVDGIKGHPDAVIDGVVVDVKSAASHQFDKFVAGIEAVEGDVFLSQYLYQLAGYVEAINPDADAAFLVIDKTLGKICVLRIPNKKIKALKIKERIAHQKEVVASDEVPERCYEPKADGKSGNMVLSTACSYCKHKFNCWADSNGGKGLRTFYYSSGPRYFTQVAREPKVIEDF